MSMRDSGFRYLSDLVEFVNGPLYRIIAVDTATEKVTVAGDISLRLNPGETFDIAGSTGNDGSYTVAALGITVNAEGNTEITVTGDITDATADGTVQPAGMAQANVHHIDEYDGLWWLTWWL